MRDRQILTRFGITSEGLDAIAMAVQNDPEPQVERKAR